jgi:hypothetical protein
MKMLSALSGNIACFHWGNMQVEIIDLLRAPIWGDLCMTNGRACIEGRGFPPALTSNRIGQLEATVRTKALKVYIIWEY